jgi:hypothetical protein
VILYIYIYRERERERDYDFIMLHYLITFYYINVMKILLLDYTFFMLLTHTPNFMFIMILFTI